MTANFSDETFHRGDQDVPAHSILAIWSGTGKTMLYTIAAKASD
jgi:hypothetical protein